MEEKIYPDIFIDHSICSAESADLAVLAKTSLIRMIVRSDRISNNDIFTTVKNKCC